MNMTNLISERLAANARESSLQADSRLSLRAGAGAETAAALGEWETEGGAAAGVPQAHEHADEHHSPVERLLLERLGEALIDEWNGVPRSLQRAIYDRAVSGCSSANRLTVRRRMARFLHDHKAPS